MGGGWQGFSPAVRPLPLQSAIFPPLARPRRFIFAELFSPPRLGLEFTATCCWTVVRTSRGCWGSFSNMADSADFWEKPLGGENPNLYSRLHVGHTRRMRGALEIVKMLFLSRFKSLLEASACKCIQTISKITVGLLENSFICYQDSSKLPFPPSLYFYPVAGWVIYCF